MEYKESHLIYVKHKHKHELYLDGYMFGGNRTRVLKRDKYKCLRCGMTNKEHIKKWKRSLSVDHIDGRGVNTPRELKNNNIDNLQTLCISCHGKKDIARLNPPKSVWQLTPDGVRIKRFESIAEASKSNGINSGGIVSCLKARKNYAGGFKWSYAEE